MSRIVGIDVRPTTVRIARLRKSFRRVSFVELREIPREPGASLEEVLVGHADIVSPGDSVSIGLSGRGAYVHRLKLPLAALKQLNEVLPYELEAQVPAEIEDLVYDARTLARAKNATTVDILVGASASTQVLDSIRSTVAALGQEPEHVGVGGVPLGNLPSVCSQMAGNEPIAILDLADRVADFTVTHQGAAVFSRSLSTGVGDLPDNAPRLIAAVRQTLVAWRMSSEQPLSQLYLSGAGPQIAGLAEALANELGLPVAALPELELETSDPGLLDLAPRFAKSIALALSLRGGSKDLNLRQGPLAYQRGYGFLKEKIPLVAGLIVIAALSFVFSAWAEAMALEAENDSLAEAMTQLSKQILNEETDDVDVVFELLDVGAKPELDPQPVVDGFDICLTLAKVIPKEIQHDIAELDFVKNNVKLSGIVDSNEEAQAVADALKKQPCYEDVKIVKVTKVVRSERQKYAMEFQIRCEDDQGVEKSEE